MKRLLILAALIFAVSPFARSQGQSLAVPPGHAMLGFCLATSGVNDGLYVPIATTANSSALPNPPTQITLFGFDSTNYDTLTCDSNGNLYTAGFAKYASAPATCSVGMVYFNTSNDTPYYCSATNTWTAFGTGAGSGTVTSVTGTANQIDVATGTTTPVVSIDPAFVFPGTASGQVVNGVSYSALYTGSTLDVRLNACIIDAEKAQNGNTTHICDATGESGTQTIASQVNVGDVSGDQVTLILPSTCTWLVNSLGSGPTTGNAFYAYTASTIRGWGQTLQQSCRLSDNTSGNFALYSYYNNTPATANGYTNLENLTIYASHYLVAGVSPLIVGGGADTSSFKHVMSLSYGNLQTTVSTSGTAVTADTGSPFTGMPTGIGVDVLINNVLYQVSAVTGGGTGLTLSTSAGTQGTGTPFTYTQPDTYVSSGANSATNFTDYYGNADNVGGESMRINGAGPVSFFSTSFSAHPFPGYPAFYCTNTAQVSFAGSLYEEMLAYSQANVTLTGAGSGPYTATWNSGQQFWGLTASSIVGIGLTTYFTVTPNTNTSATFTFSSGTTPTAGTYTINLPEGPNPWNINGSCHITYDSLERKGTGGGLVLATAPAWQQLGSGGSGYSDDFGPIYDGNGITPSSPSIVNLAMPAGTQTITSDSQGKTKSYHASYISSQQGGQNILDRVNGLISVDVTQTLRASMPVSDLPSQASIAPTDYFTPVSGTTVVNTIALTNLAGSCGTTQLSCSLLFRFDGLWQFGTAGNISQAFIPQATGTYVEMHYDPSSTACTSQPGCWSPPSGFANEITGGGGALGYSGLPVVSATVYVPVMGDTVGSVTVGNVGWPAPSASPISGLQAYSSSVPGAGNTLVVTLYDGATPEAVTCTITAAANACSDTTHTFTPAVGDLLSWQIAPTGIVVITPQIQISANWAPPLASTYQQAGGTTNYAPSSGTQNYFSPCFRLAASTTISSFACVFQRTVTVTGIQANLTGAEGAAATYAVTLATCNQAACTSVTNTGITCTIGNSVSSCNQTGQAVVINAGTQFVLVPAQTGTGTTAVYSATISYQ